MANKLGLLPLATVRGLESRLRARQREWQAAPPPIEGNTRRWLREQLHVMFPSYTPDGFADYHVEFWRWVLRLRLGTRRRPFVAVWARGGAKSTSAELAACIIAARKVRRYALYVCETQDQADMHVENIASMLTEPEFAERYPQMASRAIGKYGNSKGWRHNRLRTASGFTIDAAGLDKAVRGFKAEEERPDFFILDDIDNEQDSLVTVEKKIRTLTHAILATRSHDASVIAVQNLIHHQSIFSRLKDGRADFLGDRIVSGPHPALLDAEAEQDESGRYVIVRGTPTWPAMSVKRCQAVMDDIGLTAFQVELQHLVSERRGGMYDGIDFKRCDPDEVPDLVRVSVWVDPAVTDTDQSDAQGIQVDGVASDGIIYRLHSFEDRTSPQAASDMALSLAIRYKASEVGFETDQGGDTWRTVYEKSCENLKAELRAADFVHPPFFNYEKAGAGYGSKAHRSSFMLADYERGQIVHVRGTHEILEDALRRFPKFKPFDLADAAYWAWLAVRRAVPALPDQTATPGRMGRYTGRSRTTHPEDEWNGNGHNGSGRLAGLPTSVASRRNR